MGNFLSNLLNRHRGQTAAVKPRPVHRFEDNLPQSHAERQSPIKAGRLSAGYDWQKASRQLSSVSGYKDENEAVGIAQNLIPRVSDSALTPINSNPFSGQSHGSNKNIESSNKTGTDSLNPGSAMANNNLTLKKRSPKEPTLPSAGIESPALPDSASITPNHNPAPDRSGDSRQPKEMQRRFPNPSEIPENKLIDSIFPAKVQPVSAMFDPAMDSHPNNFSELRDSRLFGSRKTQLTLPNTPVSPSSSPQDGPPALHVTIGRIEVRAIPPQRDPTSYGPANKPGPLLSLNDYLKKRSGKNQ